MKQIFVFLLFAMPFFAAAQGKTVELVVQPKVGIVLRAAPNKGAEKLLNIPQGEIIVVDNAFLATETIGKKKGHWRKCSYKGKTGYVFDGFLELADVGETEDETETAAATTIRVTVVAPSGVVLRAAPNKGSAKVLLIATGTALELENKVAATETIEGKKGAWRLCVFNGKTGYVFDGFCKTP
jgi:hypothetical protein